MTSYRRMRRQAGRVRRSGMQPMMLISSGDQFPEPAGVLILRVAWRYRSELAPAYLASAIVGASWWLHAARPHWWPFLVGIAAVAVAALGVFAP
jgi:S-DNA-T family DNA segregation ATPase FtsK/SpoIIIE